MKRPRLYDDARKLQSIMFMYKAEIHVADSLDTQAKTILNDGGKVFINAAGKVQYGKDVVQYFCPVFWNTTWFQMRPPHTLGILLDPEHPAFENFPTQYTTTISGSICWTGSK